MNTADVTRGQLVMHLRGIFSLYVEHKGVLHALVDAAAYEVMVRDRLSQMHVGYIDRLEAHLVRGQLTGVVDTSLRTRASASRVI